MHIVAVGKRTDELNFLSAFETRPEISSGLHRKQYFPGDVYLEGMKPCFSKLNSLVQTITSAQNHHLFIMIHFCFKMLSTCTHSYFRSIFFIIWF